MYSAIIALSAWATSVCCLAVRQANIMRGYHTLLILATAHPDQRPSRSRYVYAGSALPILNTSSRLNCPPTVLLQGLLDVIQLGKNLGLVLPWGSPFWI